MALILPCLEILPLLRQTVLLEYAGLLLPRLMTPLEDAYYSILWSFKINFSDPRAAENVSCWCQPGVVKEMWREKESLHPSFLCIRFPSKILLHLKLHSFTFSPFHKASWTLKHSQALISGYDFIRSYTPVYHLGGPKQGFQSSLKFNYCRILFS